MRTRNTTRNNTEYIIKKERGVCAASDVVVSVSDLRKDLMGLIELREYDKVRELSKKHNFFNNHLHLLLMQLQDNLFVDAESTIIDLLTAPLFDNVVTEIMSDQKQELFFIPRILYIINYYTTRVLNITGDPFTRLFLEKYKEIESFNNFIYRFVDKMAIISQDLIKQELKKNLIEYAMQVIMKAEDELKLDEKFLSAPVQRLRLMENIHAYTEFTLYEILDLCYTDNSIQHKTIIQQAQKNLFDYYNGKITGNYREALCKLDLRNIMISGEYSKVIKYASYAGMYDFHPILAYTYFKKLDINTALDIIIELVEDTSLFKKKQDFILEEVKSVVRDFLFYLFERFEEKDSALRKKLPANFFTNVSCPFDSSYYIDRAQKLIEHRFILIEKP